MKKNRILIVALFCLGVAIISVGCDEAKLLNNNEIDPTGIWSSSKIRCGNNSIIINYSFEENRYSLSRYIEDVLEYEEKGIWQTSRNGLFTFIPSKCMSLNGATGILKETSTHVKYTAVCFENSFDYFYWDSNSDLLNIHVKKQ